MMIPEWDSHLCTECPNHLDLEVTEHGGRSNFWQQTCCSTNLHYKLRMFGVLIAGPVNVFCDNQGIMKNLSIPESTLMKKHNAINYHMV